MRIFSISIFLLLFTVNSFPEGKSITIQLKNNDILTGELIYAGEDGLIICTIEGLSDEELVDSLNLLIPVNYDLISQIDFKKDSKLITSILLGTGIGVGSGLLVGAIAFPGSNSSESIGPTLRFLTAALFGAIGLIVGAVSSLFSSNDEENISILSQEKIELLKLQARYDREEPSFLKNVQIE